MNKFITFTLVLFALVVSGQCGVNYGVGPAVQQVSLSAVPNIASYLNGASTAYGPSPAYVATAGPAASVSYSAAPAPAPYAAPAPPAPYAVSPVLSPATSVVVPSASPYNAPAPAPAPAPYAVPSNSYGAAPRLSVQPVHATQLYPGRQNYRAYVSPPQHSQVALPILPSDPVAKLFVPQQNSYAAPAPAPQSAYSGSY